MTPWTVACQAPRPWDFPAKNTAVGYHFILQGIFLTQGLHPHLLCLLHWQADSSSLHHLGNPYYVLILSRFKKSDINPVYLYYKSKQTYIFHITGEIPFFNYLWVWGEQYSLERSQDSVSNAHFHTFRVRLLRNRSHYKLCVPTSTCSPWGPWPHTTDLYLGL